MGLGRFSSHCLGASQRWASRALAGMALVGCGLALAILPARWAGLALGGAIVVGLTLIRPQLALYLLCFAIPFGSLFEVSLGGITAGATEALIALMICAWIARTMAFRERIAWPRLTVVLALFVSAGALSLVNAAALPYAAKEIVKWIEFAAVLVFVANAVTPRQGLVVVVCLLLAGVAQAAVGAHQFLTQSGPEHFWLMDRFMRAYGTFEQPNPYAGYLGLVAPLALALALVLLGRQRTRLRPAWLSWLGMVSFVVLAAGIGMSDAREVARRNAQGSLCVEVECVLLIAFTRLLKKRCRILPAGGLGCPPAYIKSPKIGGLIETILPVPLPKLFYDG